MLAYHAGVIVTIFGSIGGLRGGPIQTLCMHTLLGSSLSSLSAQKQQARCCAWHAREFVLKTEATGKRCAWGVRKLASQSPAMQASLWTPLPTTSTSEGCQLSTAGAWEATVRLSRLLHTVLPDVVQTAPVVSTECCGDCWSPYSAMQMHTPMQQVSQAFGSRRSRVACGL